MMRSGWIVPRRRRRRSWRAAAGRIGGVIFAVRTGAEERDAAGLVEPVVEGLREDDARTLLGSVIPSASPWSWASVLHGEVAKESPAGRRRRWPGRPPSTSRQPRSTPCRATTVPAVR